MQPAQICLPRAVWVHPKGECSSSLSTDISMTLPEAKGRFPSQQISCFNGRVTNGTGRLLSLLSISKGSLIFLDITSFPKNKSDWFSFLLYKNILSLDKASVPFQNKLKAFWLCACEHLRLKPCFVLIQEGIHYLIVHIVENFSDALESVKPIHTFQGLKTKYEQEKDLQKEELSRYGPVSV